MTWADLRLAVDISGAYLASRLLWLIASELLIKPALFRIYMRVDNALADRLPDLK